MTDPDPAATYERLRDETAAMFNYDIANLSLTQGLQLDLVSLLRLEVDTMQGKVLAGDTVDLARLVAAHGLLQKMLPAQALVAPASTADNPDPFAGAREELARLFEQRAEALARRDRRREAEMARDPDAARRELETKIQAAIEKHGKTINAGNPGILKPAAGDDAHSSVAHPLSPDAPAGGGGWPVEPASPPQPRSPASL